MTIAAYFRFSEGVLLCADSEYSHATLKLPGRKLFPVNVQRCRTNIVFALAGSVPFGKMAIQEITRRLQKLPDGSLDETSLHHELEEELQRFHDAHIYKHPDFNKYGGPDFNLIAAAHFAGTNAISTYSTSQAAVTVEGGDYYATGSGEEIAHYIVEPLTHPPLGNRLFRDILLVATHMLYQVKKFVPGCGGTSVFFLMDRKGNFHPTAEYELLAPAAYSETFQRILGDLFFAGADLSADDEAVEIMLHLTDLRIQEIRDEQRAEKQRRDELQDKLQDKLLGGDDGKSGAIVKPLGSQK